MPAAITQPPARTRTINLSKDRTHGWPQLSPRACLNGSAADFVGNPAQYRKLDLERCPFEVQSETLGFMRRDEIPPSSRFL